MHDVVYVFVYYYAYVTVYTITEYHKCCVDAMLPSHMLSE